MGLSNDLITQFVKATKDDNKKKTEATVYGTVRIQNGQTYVQLDGSDVVTPVSSSTVNKDGERVAVLIKNHTATITGNLTVPSARNDDVGGLSTAITAFEIVLADKVDTEDLVAANARIDDLVTDNIQIKENLTAAQGNIENLQTANLEVRNRLDADKASIENLETTKLDTTAAEMTYATIKNLEATNAKVNNLESVYGEFEELTTTNFEALNASVSNLETKKLDSETAAITYANIDFSNIGQAAMENFYANSGLIENVIVSNGTITGNLVGVTIRGDLIEAGTLVAEKLVIQGEDGLYYKLNTDGVTTEAEQTEYNSLNGSVITAKSITATQISVDDLVAFDATIGGFNISDDSIYSGVKSSVDNATRGIYLDSNGQMNVGDDSNFIKYYRDTDGTYKLAISAASIIFASSNKSVESALNDVVETLSVSGRNLIVRKDELVDTYVTAEGLIIDSAINYKSATMPNPIRVESGETYTFSKGESASTLFFRWAWFDENMNILGRSASDASSFSWTAPEDAYYVIVSYPYIEGANPKLEKGTEATAYCPAIEDLTDTINSVKADLNTSIEESENKLQAEIDGLTIGGRNLIINSDFRDGTNKWVPVGVTVSVEGDSTFDTYLKMVSDEIGSSSQRIYPSTTENFIHKAGTYALSFYAKADSETTMQTNIAGSTGGAKDYSLTTEWQRFTHVYESADGGSLIFWPNEAETTIYLTKIKLETGDKSTDWTPSVEEMATADEVEFAQETADNAQEAADRAESLIQQLSDSISMLVTDGNGTSLMTQTEDGWTFSTADIQAAINTTSEGLDSLTHEVKDTNSAVNVLQQAVDDLGAIAEYVKIGTYEDEPCIELGEGDSDFKLLITNTRIMFMEGSSVVAYVNNKSLHVKKAIIEEELQQGGFVWKTRANGNMGLVWKGVSG